MKAHTKETQNSMTIKSSVETLIEGNKRFLNGVSINRDFLSQVKDTAQGQYPFASILSCIDSRIPTEVIFDQGIGDLFNARIAGNFINNDILGSLEFACKLAKSKVIMVLGHTSCGAIKGACDHAKLGHLTQMLDKIMPAVDAISTPDGGERNSSNLAFVNAVSAKNVEIAVAQIKERSEVLKEMFDNGEIDIVGAMYDVNTGKVVLL